MRPAWAGLSVVLPLALAFSQPAMAQLTDGDYQDAQVGMRQFGAEMSVLVPCVYGSGGEERFVTVLIDEQPRQALQKLTERGASAAQVAALSGVFRDAYAPVWSVHDIRAFAVTCRPFIQQLNTLQGVGVPLARRQPFQR